MISEDYLYKAAETVRRKATAALELQSSAETTARSHAVGLADGISRPRDDSALAEETARALEQALGALDEIASRDRKENTRDG